MTASPLSVLIIGCGNIAGGFDLGRAIEAWPYSHAGAFRRDGRFRVLACVDPDRRKREAFMLAWDVPYGFDALAEVVAQDMRFDVVSICSPTPCHGADLETAIRLTPKAIFCEKPIVKTLAEAESLVASCENAGIPLAVNHNRRWDPEIERLRAEMQTGQRGILRSVTAVYNKGILNNGSHMIDLLHHLVGPLAIDHVGKPVADFFPDDPAVPALLSGPDGVAVHLACGHAADYAIFELQLAFSTGVVSIEDGGMSWRERHAIESDEFKGYRLLTAGSRKQGGDAQSMCNAVDNLYRAAVFGEPLSSTGKSALEAQRLCERILQLSSISK